MITADGTAVYPWNPGEKLTAAALNAAIAQGGAFVSTSPQSSPAPGALWYNTSTGQISTWDGTAWQPLSYLPLTGGTVTGPTTFSATMTLRGVAVSPAQRLYTFASGTLAGNGPDLTEDTLTSFTIPASALLNAGDTLKVIAAGAFTGSTDAKIARVRVGTFVASTFTTTAATNLTWRIEVTLTKSAANQQQGEYFSITSGGAGTTTQGNAQVLNTDTATIAFSVTGQNNTNPVANSITLRLATLDLVRA